MLEVSDLWKSYSTEDGTQTILSGVSFTLQAGQTTALTGESGSGKSTLLHLIAGLDAPDKGLVQLNGARLSGTSDATRAALRRDHIGLVFQQFNLIPSLSVQGNLAFQARLAGRYDPQWVAHMADRLGLGDLLNRYPEALSGGQQQRVAIGRALAARPDLILADEPTGNLDETSGDAVIALMLDLVADTGAGLLLVTHSTRLAGLLGHRMHLSKGQLR